jgi:hypothetical protein
MRRLATLIPALLFAALFSSPLAAAPPVMDGTLDAVYGMPVAVQTIATQFGDASLGAPGYCNGSELDALYVYAEDGIVYVFVAGNLESNYNKLELFLDAIPGGQNVLRNDNPDVDFNGLNRLAGLTFDTGFAPDYYMTVSGGDQGGTYKLFVSTAELLTGGGGNGTYVGEGTEQSDGTLTGGTNDGGFRVTLDNSNVAGVGSGCAASTGGGAVGTGIEIAFAIDSTDYAGGPVRFAVFVNGSSHDFLSNQVLGGLPDGTCNLGDPAAVNFNTLAGDQFVEVQQETPTLHRSWGQVKLRYR